MLPHIYTSHCPEGLSGRTGLTALLSKMQTNTVNLQKPPCKENETHMSNGCLVAKSAPNRKKKSNPVIPNSGYYTEAHLRAELLGSQVRTKQVKKVQSGDF